MKKLLLGVVASMLLSTTAHATEIINGSFETGTNPGGFTTVLGGNNSSIAGWTVGGASIDYIGSYWQAASGNRSIDLAGNGIGSIFQTFATVLGQTYNVSYFVSRNPDGGLTPRTGFIDVGGTPELISFTNSLSTGGNMLWEQRNFLFTATGEETTLRFSADPATSNGAYGLALDNVSIAAVPEPATWMMLILGFGLIGGAMRRRRQHVAFA
jgi:choice-of-anchor C domain-containing protein